MQSYTVINFMKELWARFMTNLDRLNNNTRHSLLIQEMQRVKDNSVMQAKRLRNAHRNKQ